jgi:hypothetical protein
MALKLGPLSVSLIMTGGRCGSLDAGLPDPRAGKSAGRLIKALLWGGGGGGLFPKSKTLLLIFKGVGIITCCCRRLLNDGAGWL